MRCKVKLAAALIWTTLVGVLPPTTSDLWVTYVANSGTQAEVDTCTGGLTYGVKQSRELERDYYGIHVSCGGAPLLRLNLGATIVVVGLGTYKVVDSKTVKQGDSTDAVFDIHGEILLQTCYRWSDKMRVVGVSQIG
jgi:hypothetical protein